MCFGDWLVALLNAKEAGQVIFGCDDPFKRVFGFTTLGVEHVISLSSVQNQPEWFQTDAQRDRVFKAFKVDFDALKDTMREPEGRERLYQGAL